MDQQMANALDGCHAYIDPVEGGLVAGDMLVCDLRAGHAGKHWDQVSDIEWVSL